MNKKLNVLIVEPSDDIYGVIKSNLTQGLGEDSVIIGGSDSVQGLIEIVEKSPVDIIIYNVDTKMFNFQPNLIYSRTVITEMLIELLKGKNIKVILYSNGLDEDISIGLNGMIFNKKVGHDDIYDILRYEDFKFQEDLLGIVTSIKNFNPVPILFPIDRYLGVYVDIDTLDRRYDVYSIKRFDINDNEFVDCLLVPVDSKSGSLPFIIELEVLSQNYYLLESIERLEPNTER